MGKLRWPVTKNEFNLTDDSPEFVSVDLLVEQEDTDELASNDKPLLGRSIFYRHNENLRKGEKLEKFLRPLEKKITPPHKKIWVKNGSLLPKDIQTIEDSFPALPGEFVDDGRFGCCCCPGL